MNIKPDKTMQDEGMAREVINRIQKLRKKVILTIVFLMIAVKLSELVIGFFLFVL